MSLIVKNVDWQHEKGRLCKLREHVFVYEWQIPAEYEFDQQDDNAVHVIIFDDEQDVATGRLTSQGEIGRIAVLQEYRGPDIYRTLFSALIEQAKSLGIEHVSVQCELEGVDAFQQHGFTPIGSVFMDAGVARQKMSCLASEFDLPKVELTH